MKKTRYAVIKVDTDDDKVVEFTLYSGNDEKTWFFDKRVTLSPKEIKELWQNIIDNL